MCPFHLRCISVNKGQSVNFVLSQNSRAFSNNFEHKCHIHDSNRSELRQCSVKMGRCRSVCGNSCIDGAMMSGRVAIHWDAHMTDTRRCRLVCHACGGPIWSRDSMDEQVLGFSNVNLIVQHHAYIRAQAEVLQESRRQR